MIRLAVLVRYAVTFPSRTSLPFVLGVVATCVLVALIFFRQPASPPRWAARASGVLDGLAVVAFVVVLALTGINLGPPYPWRFLLPCSPA
jgi:hypothetical protein